MDIKNLLILPNQLYHNTDHMKDMDNIYLMEEPRYFTDFKFHKMKLVYHRASMKNYINTIKKYNIKYIDFEKVKEFYSSIKKENNTYHIINPADHALEKKLKKIFGKKLVIMENKNFLITIDELKTIKDSIYRNNKYSHEEFYKYQRKKLDILMNKDKPMGGKWSYDSENRLALPNNIKLPKVKSIKKNKYIIEAIKYVDKHFPTNYGMTDTFYYPINSKTSKKWLEQFLKERLDNFGPYEDAVSDEEPFIYHSVLSPMMNIGLITDKEVVEISYEYYKKHIKTIPLQSFEGFIRQVVGWRNYVYTIYMLEGETMYNSNMLKHTNKLSDKFWTGTTGILPIDSIIKKIVKYSYAHHIERLMYLGNFLLISMIDPKEVYRIFMEWTIDSYDWVMVPNIFGMSQYATNNMMTRPYFSSSNYIIRMSNYKKDGEWDKIWDSLYYNFIDKHIDMLKSNYATAMMAKHWNNKTDDMKKDIKKIAKDFIKNIY